jgi:class 3 adenylate cyclase
MREHVIRVERTFAGGPLRVWALAADSNRWDRALGLPPANYVFRDEPDGSRARIGGSKVLGLPVAWVEAPYQWVEGAWVEGSRRYLEGPVARGTLRCEVFSAGPRATRVVVRFTVASASPLAAVGGRLAVPVFRRAIERYLDVLGRALTAAPDGADDVAQGRDLALSLDDAALRGAVTPADEAELARRAAAATGDGRAPQAALAALVAWVRAAPDDDVETMRPLALARRWGVTADEGLRAFLLATRAGLVDLRWKLLCPVCRTGADTASSLTEVGRRVRCDACDRDYDVDFSEHVEAVFAPNPAVRAVTPRLWCASSASRRPHVVAQVTLDPGATFRASLRAYDGPLLARVMGGADVTPLPAADPAPARVTVTACDDARPVVTDESGDGGRGTELVLRNLRARPVTLQIERAGAPRDALTGAGLLLFPDYLDLFATDAPARGVELSVGAVALLFTDLTGSTALYERVGDARAFALIEQHFREMTRVVSERGGTVVKTMGDAVMAAFPRLGDAARAGVEMARATSAQLGDEGVALKVGVHLGPCLAVRANDRLDFFGTTVNVAARLQARAEAHELVLVESTARHPDVALALADMPRRAFTASLKGIRQELHLVAVDVRALP